MAEQIVSEGEKMVAELKKNQTSSKPDLKHCNELITNLKVRPDLTA